MTDITRLSRILELMKPYVPADASLAAEHDIIFLPLTTETTIPTEIEEELDALGAWKDDDFDCWAIYT
jgi:hypothetical protein